MTRAAWPPIALPEAHEVQLWWGRVGGEDGTPGRPVEPDPEWLSDAERAQAERFHFERDRRRFRWRRAFLRGVLGRALERDPAALRFELGERGKPRLAGTDAGAGDGLTFNLSHSEEWVLLGLARGRELGVDVELHKLRTELDAMARQVFTARECEELQVVDEEQRLATFFRGWTRKEAVLKATGEGFGREPRTLDVGLERRDAASPWRAEREPELAPYRLLDLDAPAGASAALCVEGEGWRWSLATARPDELT